MTSTTTTTQRYQRKDGRDMMQIRPISLTMGDIAGRSNTASSNNNDNSTTSTSTATSMSATSTTSTTSGCAKYRCGSSCVLALVFGPSTAKATSERYDQAVIQVSIQRTTTNNNSNNSNSAAGAEATKLLAVHEKRRQQIEENRIVSMIRRVLMDTVIDVTQFPRCVIGVNLQILQQDGSLEACCFNAAMAAILDSGIRCKTTIAAVSVGALVEGDSKNIIKNDDAAAPTSTSTSTSTTILDLTDFEESEFVKSRSSSERTDDEQQKQQQFQLPPLKAKGTFVVSYPASSGGIVATSDILFVQTQQQQQQLESLTQMERAANAAGGRLFEIFREAVAQKTQNGGSDNTDSAM